MYPTLDDAAEAPNQSGRTRQLPVPRLPELPDVYEAPKRRLHPMIVAGIGFIGAGAVFYGAQMFAPAAFKPASIIGGYDTEILEARRSGELAAQIRYEAQLRNVELQHQAQLREIEVAAGQWQERYRTVLGGALENYRATWTRANIYAQATAEIQRQYVQARTEFVRGTLRGERDMANNATTLGMILGLVNPEIGAAVQGYADGVRDRALQRLDYAASSGVTITIDGWDTGLTHPDDLADALYGIEPLELPIHRARPVTVQEVHVPGEPAR